MQSKLDILTSVINNHQYIKVKSRFKGKNKTLLLDPTTAKAILKVYECLTPGSQISFLKMSWHRIANLTLNIAKVGRAIKCN